MTRIIRSSAVLVAAFAILLAQIASAAPQPPTGAALQAPAVTTSDGTTIAAESAQYGLRWDGKTGKLIIHGTNGSKNGDDDRAVPMVYLHHQAGPKGFADSLVWFEARDARDFYILWLYLDGAGHGFDAYIYRFRQNLLQDVTFRGDYVFKASPEPAAQPAAALDISNPPAYRGAAFTYRDWTANGGVLPALPIRWTGAAPGAPGRSITSLHVSPLYVVQVDPGNGWRNGGWRELHSVATDVRGDPYYLILYTNSPTGFAVDLLRGQTYVADYASTVMFDPTSTQTNGIASAPPSTLQVRQYAWHEFALSATGNYENPYASGLVSAEFRGPNGKTVLVPGFWRGDNHWVVRFSPSATGNWTWRTLSNDGGMNGQEGSFECVASDIAAHGFLTITTERDGRANFGSGDGKPVLPQLMIWPDANTAAIANPGVTDSPALQRFRAYLDSVAKLGINRFVGGMLLGGYPDGAVAHNEGGSMWIGDDPDRLNPKFFDWMDRRVELCNAAGIVPDIGIGKLSAALFTRLTDAQLRRFWLYVVGRYGCYDVCWNLFDEPADADSALVARGDTFGNLTRLYDPYRHPISLVKRLDASTDLNALPRWLDVITDDGPTPAEAAMLAASKRPLIAITPIVTGAPSQRDDPASLRAALWYTRMLNGYPAVADDGKDGKPGPALQTAAVCASMFRETRYWRLAPHPELLVAAPADASAAKPAAAPGSGLMLLADPGFEYVVYFPAGGSASVDLLRATGHVRTSWFDPRSGTFTNGDTVVGGTTISFSAPDARDWVLYLTRR